jgi:hypothetical protein
MPVRALLSVGGYVYATHYEKKEEEHQQSGSGL